VKLEWLEVSPAGWSVRARLVNRSGHVLRPVRTGKTGWGWSAESSDRTMHRVAEASSFRPALPHRLRPGARWSGTFSGTGRLPRRWLVSFGLGYYDGWPRGGFGLDTDGRAPLRIP
jgi:hypothetical protein